MCSDPWTVTNQLCDPNLGGKKSNLTPLKLSDFTFDIVTGHKIFNLFLTQVLYKPMIFSIYSASSK